MASASPAPSESRPPATPTPPAATATRATAAPATTVPGSPSARPSADGTVDPLGFGDVTPIATKPDTEVQRPHPLLRDVRIGVHAEQGGWDRIVFEFSGGLPGAQIAYTPQVSQCGSGQPVTVPGSAVLSVRFGDAAAHDDQGKPTFGQQSLTGPGPAIRGVRQFCDFEGVVSWAVGVSGQQRYKVTRLSNPARLVIDIKHP